MTRNEIIEKGEKQLQYTLNRLEKGCTTSSKALAQLDMLSYILDEEWDKYDYWFNEFIKYS